MPTSDPVSILLTHNRWATRALIDACATLTDEQFHQPFDMGPGSLHDTIVHILGAMRGWGDLLAGRAQRPRLEADERRSCPDLLNLLDQLADDLDNSARTHPTDGIATGERNGHAYSFNRGTVLTHLSTHGMHHRAQCLNMLRVLGVDPLPPSAVVEWSLMVDHTG